jgi:signal transduction histidine kinase
MVTVEQAVAILERFQSAAPTKSAGKLADVIALLESLDSEVSYLNTQLQEALAVSEAQAAAVPTASPNGAVAPAPIELPRQRSGVTDQLASLYDMMSTAEVDQTHLNGASAPAYGSGDYEYAQLPPALRSDELPIDPQFSNDPMSWLSEMPHLLLSEAEQLEKQVEAQVVSAKLKTAPIFDLMTPMQETLRPSMMMIRAQAERLHSGKMGKLTTEQTVATRTVRDHADSALSLLDAAEQVAALNQGLFVLEYSTFSCSDLIKRTRDLMLPTARAREHRITIYPGEKNLIVTADYDTALAILIDLLDNAIRYTPTGGATRITVDDLGTHAVINVADNGIGLLEEDFQYVGKPFWRALHQPLVEQNPGSGLRLYLAQRILALQGGELIFSGEKGVGSTFSITLPIRQG